MIVKLHPTAVVELAGIWEWNADRYGRQRADGYAAFLRHAIDQLPGLVKLSLPVPGRPEYRYTVIRRRSGGHGHVAVYRLREGLIEVLHLFHTAQDWQTRLAGESPAQ